MDQKTKYTSAVSILVLGFRVGLSYLLTGILQEKIIAWAEIGSWIFGWTCAFWLYRTDAPSGKDHPQADEGMENQGGKNERAL